MARIEPSHITCAICYEIFFDPVSLPCGHSYCWNCLEKSATLTLKKKECPTCREKWEDWPKSNVALNDIVKHCYPERWEQGEAEIRAITQEKKRLQKQTTQENMAHRHPILMGEAKILLLGLLLLFIMLWSK